ncbi:MAG: TlpA family protein disulfide reductase [Lachnospiraceae bacterium]|nr:TlpA family protein disulfide reductase [Lachnospiraceae bacterium]
MKKKIACSLLIFALAASLTACGGSGTAPTESAASAAETTQAEGGAAETEAAQKETTETDAETAQAEDGGGLAFETTDLEGNAVSASDIFRAHKLTMINIWGTYCGPCIGEMPDLEVLNTRLAEKDCAIIGIVCDVRGSGDTKTIGIAKDIISQTGVTYLNLLPWETFWDELPAELIPTTYFITSDGQVVGEAAVGARGADEYEALVDELLAEME